MDNEPPLTIVSSSGCFFRVQVSFFICLKLTLSKIAVAQNTCPNSSSEYKYYQLKRFVAFFFSCRLEEKLCNGLEIFC